VKSTGENEESFPAFDDLFDDYAALEEENESPAVEEKVEVKVILKEIGQNSEEWKDAMDKFPSAKMYWKTLVLPNYKLNLIFSNPSPNQLGVFIARYASIIHNVRYHFFIILFFSQLIYLKIVDESTQF
jgi:hypothetical protein